MIQNKLCTYVAGGVTFGTSGVLTKRCGGRIEYDERSLGHMLDGKCGTRFFRLFRYFQMCRFRRGFVTCGWRSGIRSLRYDNS